MQCQNNLKQQGMAAQTHLSASRHFPSGGWGAYWVGDPDRGFSKRQPGGWMYNLLPYMEYKGIHEMGKGVPFNDKKNLFAKMNTQPLSEFICPTRRACIVYPASTYGENGPRGNMNGSPVHARSDYAGNGGAGHADELRPAFGAKVDTGEIHNVGPVVSTYAAADVWTGWTPEDTLPNLAGHTGVIYQRSTLKEKEIVDGLSRTIIFSEKYLNPDAYFTGTDPADSGPIFQGYDWDIIRLGNSSFPPYRDRRGQTSPWSFGSAHALVFQVVLCDGSTHALSYDIDIRTLARLSCRKDKQPIDSSLSGF
jgi:hypothetical protein